MSNDICLFEIIGKKIIMIILIFIDIISFSIVFIIVKQR